jgi:DNA-binding NarL/FixJ family response regulator
MAEGLGGRAIAEALLVSRRTVANHVGAGLR